MLEQTLCGLRAEALADRELLREIIRQGEPPYAAVAADLEAVSAQFLAIIDVGIEVARARARRQNLSRPMKVTIPKSWLKA